MTLLIKSTPENRKLVFNAIKAKILKHLEELEKEETSEIKKTFSELTGLLIKGGRGLPVGTIREWKGKKFIKVAPGKWRPKYDSETRGAKLAISVLKKKIELCEDEREMMRLVLENRDRFSDKNGNPLPFVQQLSDFISQTQEKKTGKADNDDSRFTDSELKERIRNGKKIIADFFKESWNDENYIKMGRDRLMDIWAAAEAERYEFVNTKTDMFKKLPASEKKKAKEFNDKLKHEFKAEAAKIFEEYKKKDKLVNSGSNDGEESPDDFKGKTSEAISFLLKHKEGEAKNALYHKDIGYIDIVYGKEGTAKSGGYGLAKIAKFHPEVLDNLQEIISSMMIVGKTKNRIQLESKKHKASIRLEWNGESKKWLLTAFEKESDVSDSRTDIAGTDNSRKNDTATPTNIASISVPQSGEKSSNKTDKNAATNDYVGKINALIDKGNAVLEKYDDDIKDVKNWSKEELIDYITTQYAGFISNELKFTHSPAQIYERIENYKKKYLNMDKADILFDYFEIIGDKQVQEGLQELKEDLKGIEQAKTPEDFENFESIIQYLKSNDWFDHTLDYQDNTNLTSHSEHRPLEEVGEENLEVTIHKNKNVEKLIEKLPKSYREKIQQFIDKFAGRTYIFCMESWTKIWKEEMEEHNKERYKKVISNRNKRIRSYQAELTDLKERLKKTPERFYNKKGDLKKEIEEKENYLNEMVRKNKITEKLLSGKNSAPLSKSIVWLQNYLSKSEQKEESAIEALRKRLEKEGR
ncbi:hypothetical protein [Treponema putidum]|uniref:putative barnase/colicin E5 family endoribonuclease n=1 Tax=Treponema putidum TaxID=221027 RepID=UPI003D91A431